MPKPKLPNTLLTIDLDYWTNDNTFKKDLIKAAKFLKAAIQAAPKVSVIKYHDEIIHWNLIPRGTKKVINIDYHNDIIADAWNDGDLNEGTWGNFVPTGVKKFEWRYPNHNQCVKRGLGLCEPVGQIKHYPIPYVPKLGLKRLPWSKLNGLVICLSPNWDHGGRLDELLQLMDICPKNTNIADYISHRGARRIK